MIEVLGAIYKLILEDCQCNTQIEDILEEVEPGFGFVADGETAHWRRHKRTREGPRPWRRGRGARSGAADSPSRRDCYPDLSLTVDYNFVDAGKIATPRVPARGSVAQCLPTDPAVRRGKGSEGEDDEERAPQTLDDVESCSCTTGSEDLGGG